MKKGIFIFVIVIEILCSGCIYQEDERIKNLKNEIQPELDSQKFIELVNAIFVEKVRLEEFDIRSDGYPYIKNTFDHDGNEIFISMSTYPTEIYLSICRGHFVNHVLREKNICEGSVYRRN